MVLIAGRQSSDESACYPVLRPSFESLRTRAQQKHRRGGARSARRLVPWERQKTSASGIKRAYRRGGACPALSYIPDPDWGGRASVMPLFGATHPSPESSPDRERRILQRLIPADHAVGAADYPPFGVDVIAPTISGVIAWHARHRLARTAKPSRLVGRRSGFGSALGIARR
jgi:hypothetical protein